MEELRVGMAKPGARHGYEMNPAAHHGYEMDLTLPAEARTPLH